MAMKHLAAEICMLLMILGFISSCTDVRGEPVEYKSGDVVLKGYLAYDHNYKGKQPGILVVHEWWGNNEYSRKRAMMLAQLGYTALAVDMYGEGRQAAHPEEAREFANEISENINLKASRFMAAMNFLQQQNSVDPDKIAAIGYCFGGSVVLEMARSGLDLNGVVSFHGGLSTKNPAKPGAVKTRILVCHGEKDSFITDEQVAAFKQEMADAGADMQFITYKDATHVFTNPEADTYAKEFNMPVKYNKAADKKSWNDMKGFLKKVFEKS